MNSNLLNNPEAWFITFLASFLIWFMFGGLVFFWLLQKRVKKEHIFYSMISILIAWIVSLTIKVIMPVPRPFMVSDLTPWTITIPTDPAFPSIHTSTAFAMAISIQRNNKRLGLLFISLAILVALGRVLSNVHNYIDILGGLAIGAISVATLESLHKRDILKN